MPYPELPSHPVHSPCILSSHIQIAQSVKAQSDPSNSATWGTTGPLVSLLLSPAPTLSLSPEKLAAGHLPLTTHLIYLELPPGTSPSQDSPCPSYTPTFLLKEGRKQLPHEGLVGARPGAETEARRHLSTQGRGYSPWGRGCLSDPLLPSSTSLEAPEEPAVHHQALQDFAHGAAGRLGPLATIHTYPQGVCLLAR